MKVIAQQITALSQHDIAAFERIGEISVRLDGDDVQLSLEDVEIHTKDVPGMLVATENGITVALDISISDALRKEGVARELVNRIQNLRKDSGLEVTDRINITLQKQPELEAAVADFGDYIKEEVLANAIIFDENVAGDVLSFDGIESAISIEKDISS